MGGDTTISNDPPADRITTQDFNNASQLQYPDWFVQAQRQAIRRANQAYKKAQALGPYQGDFIAGADPLQIESLQGREAFARGMPDMGADLTQLGLDTAQGRYLNIDSNPYIGGYIDAAVNPIRDQSRAMQDRASSEAIQQGAYGGSREAILQGEIARETARAIGDTTNQIAFNTYNAERQNQLNAPYLLDQGVKLSLMDEQLLGDVGAGYRGFAQDALSNEQLQFQEELNSYFRGLPEYASTLGVVRPPYTTTSFGSSVNSEYLMAPSTAQQVISGVLGGGAAGASLGQSLGGKWGGTVGGLIGGGLGGYGGYADSRRWS